MLQKNEAVKSAIKYESSTKWCFWRNCLRNTVPILSFSTGTLPVPYYLVYGVVLQVIMNSANEKLYDVVQRELFPIRSIALWPLENRHRPKL